MKVLLLADIHGNWPALQAIREPHDLCFCLGDFVDYALEPAPCIEWAQTHAHAAIRGNHDHAVAQRVLASGKTGYKYLSGVTRRETWDRLRPNHVRYLAGLPVTRYVSVGDARFLLVHATPRDPFDEYVAGESEAWTKLLRNVEADFICVGHTHHPYVLPVNGQTVINPGSVGQPRDGDPRAAYAVWEDGRVELKRVEYPIDETIQSIQSSELPEEAKAISIAVFRRGKLPESARS